MAVSRKGARLNQSYESDVRLLVNVIVTLTLALHCFFAKIIAQTFGWGY